MVVLMENNKQQARRKQEDAALNKLLIWFGLAIGYEAIVLLLKRFYINFRSEGEIYFAVGLAIAFQILQWVGPILTLGALAWLIYSRRQGKSVKTPAICTAALLAFSFTVIVAYRFSTNGVDLLGAVAPAVAVCALIYYLYQRDFFCNTLFTAGGILSLWLYRRFYATHPTTILLGFVLGWLLLAAVVYLAVRLSRQNGRWGKLQIFPSNTLYIPTYVTCGVTALTMVCAMIFGAAAAYYAIFVLVIWLFCMAVYYTVRMM